MICSEDHRKVYILRCKGYSLQEIGKICHLSPERCRQIYSKVKKKLEIELNEVKEQPQLKEHEKQIIWALYQIKDDIKHLAEK